MRAPRLEESPQDRRTSRGSDSALDAIIVRAADAALGHQRRDGSFAPGHNGPYHDPETPVRNTAHWSITMLRAHGITGDGRFAAAAARAAAHLTAAAARPQGAAFCCRTAPGKDPVNGLIGQAWAVEALVELGGGLGDPRCGELAREVVELHPFDHEWGLWYRVRLDGRPTWIDRTLNHQLWFAAAAARLASDRVDPIHGRVVRFLDRIRETHLRVATGGRVGHRIAGSFPPGDGATAGADPAPREATVAQEIGYHAFNLYALALLRPRAPEHPLWTDPRLRAALGFVDTDEFLDGLEDNPYADPYNPVGFEVALGLDVLAPPASARPRPAAWWVARQLERSWDPDSASLVRGSIDPAVSAARLYEATRLGRHG